MRPRYSWADVDHKFLSAKPARDRLWLPGSNEAHLEMSTTALESIWRRRLYTHQWDAFSRATYGKENVVVATGTGSGTECFQLPMLYRLLTEPPVTRARRGVRALLVYPLNALVEDQSARLRRLLFWINLQFHDARNKLPPNHQITFGRYTGDTPVDRNDRLRRESDEALRGFGELVYREDMQESPPDILITNFTMLEYMLLREGDRQLFGSPDLFSLVVLDEIHTYSGTQGMEVAMLLRRLKGFLDSKSKAPVRVQCLGTSATLGGEDLKKDAAAFATTLFGSQFLPEGVVLGSRTPPILGAPIFCKWHNLATFLCEHEQDALRMLLEGEEISSDKFILGEPGWGAWNF